jgi:uncharacterized protein
VTLQRLLAALFALFLAAALPAQAQTFPKLSGRVVDAANLLAPEQEAQLTALSESIEQASSRQFVVATIPSLEDRDIADYGYQLGRAWKIGQSEANNGILLIVAPNERKVRIEVGYGLEPIMTDALSSRIINEQILPRFRQNDMPGGIIAGAQAIGEQMKLPLEAAEARAREQTQKAQPSARRASSGGFPWGLAFWGLVFLFVIVPMLFRSRRRGRRYRGGDGGAWPIVLWSIANEMSRSSHHSGWGDGGSGWGGGGGGWGGGGGFSGGGGSFGGGGASGSW